MSADFRPDLEILARIADDFGFPFGPRRGVDAQAFHARIRESTQL